MAFTHQNPSDINREEIFAEEMKEIVQDFVSDKFSEQDVELFLSSISKILEIETKNLIFQYNKPDYLPEKQIFANNFGYQSNPSFPNQPMNFNSFQNFQQMNYQPYPSQFSVPNSQIIYPNNYTFNANPQIQYQQPVSQFGSALPIQYQSVNQNDEKDKKKHKEKDDKKSHKKKDDKKSHKKKDNKKKKKGDKKKKKEEKEDGNANTIEFMNHSGDTFDGIFNYLTQQSGGNIQLNGTIDVYSNSIGSSRTQNFVDYSKRICGASSSSGDTYICFDLKERRIQVTGYLILTFANDSGFGQIKNWVIEVSDDKNTWVEIDRHENDETTKASSIYAYFKVQKIIKKHFYKFVRIRQTGESWDPDKRDFGFNAIEFFGVLQDPKK